MDAHYVRAHAAGVNRTMRDQDRAKNLIKTKELGFSVLRSLKTRKMILRIFYFFVCGFLYVAEFPVLAVGLFTGYMVGIVLEDILWIREIKKSWPFTERVINWKKVEEIANSKDS